MELWPAVSRAIVSRRNRGDDGNELPGRTGDGGGVGHGVRDLVGLGDVGLRGEAGRRRSQAELAEHRAGLGAEHEAAAGLLQELSLERLICEPPRLSPVLGGWGEESRPVPGVGRGGSNDPRSVGHRGQLHAET